MLRAAYFMTPLTKYLRIPMEVPRRCRALKDKTSASQGLADVKMFSVGVTRTKTRIRRRPKHLIPVYFKVPYLS